MEENLTKPKLTGTAKLDATTDAAYEIIDKLDLERDRKTARLKALRLLKEEASRANVPKIKPAKKRSSNAKASM